MQKSRPLVTLSLLVASALAGCQLGPKTDTNSISQSGPPDSLKQHLPDFFSAQKSKANNSTLHPMVGQQQPSTMDRMKQSASSLARSLGTSSDTSESFSNDPTSLQFETGPIQPELHLSAARMSEQQGNLESAEKHYALLLRMQPKNRNGLIGLARVHHRQGDMTAAIRDYQVALSRLGNDPVILNDLALCLARNGRSQDAVSALETALKQQPGNAMYRNNLAAILVQSGQSEQAVAALMKSNRPAVAHYNVAYLLNKRGEVDSAGYHFGEALRHDPNFEAARTMLDQITPMIGQRPQPDALGHADVMPRSELAAMENGASPRVQPIAATAERMSPELAAAVARAMADMPSTVTPIWLEAQPTTAQLASRTIVDSAVAAASATFEIGEQPSFGELSSTELDSPEATRADRAETHSEPAKLPDIRMPKPIPTPSMQPVVAPLPGAF